MSAAIGSPAGDAGDLLGGFLLVTALRNEFHTLSRDGFEPLTTAGRALKQVPAAFLAQALYASAHSCYASDAFPTRKGVP